jgi:hypothetical protein
LYPSVRRQSGTLAHATFAYLFVVASGTGTPTLRVDFQNADAQGRVRFNTTGAEADIAEQGIELRTGLRVRLLDAELAASGEVTWSDDEQLWVAAVDWDDVTEHPLRAHS